jgi:hypothetical protein
VLGNGISKLLDLHLHPLLCHCLFFALLVFVLGPYGPLYVPLRPHPGIDLTVPLAPPLSLQSGANALALGAAVPYGPDICLRLDLGFGLILISLTLSIEQLDGGCLVTMCGLGISHVLRQSKYPTIRFNWVYNTEALGEFKHTLFFVWWMVFNLCTYDCLFGECRHHLCVVIGEGVIQCCHARLAEAGSCPCFLPFGSTTPVTAQAPLILPPCVGTIVAWKQQW